MSILNALNAKNISLFASGLAMGTAGIKILASRDARKVYVGCVAAGLRAKECVLDTVTKVQENAEDILAEAKQINEERAAEDAAREISGDAAEQNSEA